MSLSRIEKNLYLLTVTSVINGEENEIRNCRISAMSIT